MLSWKTRLIRPVTPADGMVIVTLSDTRAYALSLPKAKQNDPHVLAGIAALMLAADGQVPDLVAQIVHGPPKSLGRGKPDPPWMKRKART